jgi:signal transduction histidine kinase
MSPNSARLPRPRWLVPIVPAAPASAIILGTIVAVAFGWIGILLLHQQAVTDARMRAEVLARAACVELEHISKPDQATFVSDFARREDIAVSARSVDGSLIASAGTPTPPSNLEQQIATCEAGEVTVGVTHPNVDASLQQMYFALAVLALLFGGLAASVAYVVARDVRRDVVDLTRRVRDVARGTSVVGEVVDVRMFDEVGALGLAFNGLAQRFVQAEKGYADALSRIEELDSERTTFLANVSHELRSPLNAILGFSDILLSEVDGPLDDESREEIAIIKQSGEHLLSLINDILDLSALASGQIELHKEPTDLRSLVEDVVREARGARGDRPISLTFSAGADQKPSERLRLENKSDHWLISSKMPAVLMASIDPKRIRQVVTNLLSNAIKFTKEGSVSVSLHNEQQVAIITVADTGPGIDEREMSTIFEEFQQGGDRRSRRRGTGLGLSIARRLVVMHGGSIAVKSRLGEGSEFTVRIPLLSVLSSDL